jgi:hypothetical protein
LAYDTPKPPGDLHLNMVRTEIMEYCQTPAKKFFNNIQVIAALTIADAVCRISSPRRPEQHDRRTRSAPV